MAAGELPPRDGRPLLMFDVMDTLVHDPFFKTMPGAARRPRLLPRQGALRGALR
jgi:hypothetical protein